MSGVRFEKSNELDDMLGFASQFYAEICRAVRFFNRNLIGSKFMDQNFEKMTMIASLSCLSESMTMLEYVYR